MCDADYFECLLGYYFDFCFFFFLLYRTAQGLLAGLGRMDLPELYVNWLQNHRSLSSLFEQPADRANEPADAAKPAITDLVIP